MLCGAEGTTEAIEAPGRNPSCRPVPPCGPGLEKRKANSGHKCAQLAGQSEDSALRSQREGATGCPVLRCWLVKMKKWIHGAVHAWVHLCLPANNLTSQGDMTIEVATRKSRSNLLYAGGQLANQMHTP